MHYLIKHNIEGRFEVTITGARIGYPHFDRIRTVAIGKKDACSLEYFNKYFPAFETTILHCMYSYCKGLYND